MNPIAIYFLLFISLSESTFYPKHRCEKNDCSFQISSVENKSCVIHRPTVCNDSFPKFASTPVKELSSEDDSKFFVSIFPYTAFLYEQYMTVSRSAINITFAINHKDVREAAIILTSKAPPLTICRILDFNSANIINLPMKLFYDCLANLADKSIQHVFMTFIALPMNERLSYYVFIPRTEFLNTCSWQPVIMIFCGNLNKGIVQVKFSQAPSSLKVSFYLVKIKEKFSNEEKILKVPSDLRENMIYAEFTSLNEGNYSVSVKSISVRSKNCWSETEYFLVGNSKVDYMLTLYICILVLFILSALIFLIIFRRNILKIRFGSKLRILLLYSHDCREHEDFIVAFIDYLEKKCHSQVYSIYGNSDDPTEWIKNYFYSCDVIMIVISAGLFHTLDTKNFLPIRKGHKWRKQLIWARNFISYELLNSFEDCKNKRICQVCFPYSGKQHIPDRLKTVTKKCFMLPNEINNLNNFMHGHQTFFSPINMCYSLKNNLRSSVESRTLGEKIQAVQEAVKNNTHIHLIKLPDNSNNGFNVSSFSNLDDVNLDDFSDSSDFVEENCNSFLMKLLSPRLSSEKSQTSLSSHSSNRYNFTPDNENYNDISILESTGEQLLEVYPESRNNIKLSREKPETSLSSHSLNNYNFTLDNENCNNLSILESTEEQLLEVYPESRNNIKLSREKSETSLSSHSLNNYNFTLDNENYNNLSILESTEEQLLEVCPESRNNILKPHSECEVEILLDDMLKKSLVT
ncbi:SEFIR domain-containing protein [Trichonephila clavata]|uniref:SEFIR domain-containing protein n=1 Tax=Trichonephila clavata TaxID=2740835 RepID=A0A8X6M378_TRICU|nr:SEFIR domain-containing protein [Trichonephila clavata]